MEYVPRLVIVVTCIGGSACWQCAARGVVWQAWTCCLTGENERAQSSGDLKDKERKIRRWIVGAKLSSCILLRIVHEHAKSRQPSHTSLKNKIRNYITKQIAEERYHRTGRRSSWSLLESDSPQKEHGFQPVGIRRFVLSLATSRHHTAVNNPMIMVERYCNCLE